MINDKIRDNEYDKDMNGSPYIKVFKKIYNIEDEEIKPKYTEQELNQAPKDAVIVKKVDSYEIVGEVVNPRAIARESDFVRRIKVFFSNGSSVLSLCVLSFLMIIPMVLLLVGINGLQGSSAIIAFAIGKNALVTLNAGNIYSMLKLLLIIQVLLLVILFVKSILSTKASRRYKFSGIAAIYALISILFLIGFLLAKGNGVLEHMQGNILNITNFDKFSMFLSIGITVGGILLLLFAAAPYIIAFIAENDLAENYIIKNKKRRVIIETQASVSSFAKNKFSYIVSILMSLALVGTSIAFVATNKIHNSLEFVNILTNGTFAINLTKNFNDKIIFALSVISLAANAYMLFKTIASMSSKKRYKNSIFIALLQMTICIVVLAMILLKEVLTYNFYIKDIVPFIVIIALNVVFIISTLTVYKKRVE